MNYLDEMHDKYIPCTKCGESFLSYCEELHTICNTCNPVKPEPKKLSPASEYCTTCNMHDTNCECLPF